MKNIFKIISGKTNRAETPLSSPQANSRIEEITSYLSSLSLEDRAYFFVDSVWTRAGLQKENYFKLPDGTSDHSAGVNFWMSTTLDELYKELRKQKRTDFKVLGVEFWFWISSGIVDTRTHKSLIKMWSLIDATKMLWTKKLKVIYEQSKVDMNNENLEEVDKLAKEILAKSPPAYLSLHKVT